MSIRIPFKPLSAILALVASVALGAGPVQASPLLTFEDFESAPVKDASLPSLSTLVGLFTPASGFNVFVTSPGYTNFGPGLNPTTSSILTASGDENFSWQLAFSAQTVQLEMYLNDRGPATMEFFDAANALLGSITYGADSDPTNNLVTLSFDAGADIITRATFVSTNGGALNTGLDNIRIRQGTGGTVPAPGSLALVATAVVLAAAAGRRPARQVS